VGNAVEFKNILFCTDYSEDAETAFVHAFDQAQKYNSALHIMNVIPSVNPCDIHLDENITKKESRKISADENEKQRLQELGALKKVYYTRCEELYECYFVVKVGSSDIQIIDYADENYIDMIIMGTAGRHEKKRLTYIKTAANVSKFANCQVITIGSPKE